AERSDCRGARRRAGDGGGLARRGDPGLGLTLHSSVGHRALELVRGHEGLGGTVALEIVGDGDVVRAVNGLVHGVVGDAHRAARCVELVVSLPPGARVVDGVADEETDHESSFGLGGSGPPYKWTSEPKRQPVALFVAGFCDSIARWG